MYRMIKYKVFWKEIYECSVFMQNVFDVFFDQKQIENNFLLKIIIGDKTWIFTYNQKIKLQLSKWHTQ